MPITAASVLEPAGHIAPALFPADSSAELTTRLSAYVTEAYARAAVAAVEAGAERDEAAAAWVYARAFRAAYIERSAEHARVSIEGQGSSGFDMRQLTNLAREAESWRAQYDALTADLSVESRRPARTSSAPARFHF